MPDLAGTNTFRGSIKGYAFVLTVGRDEVGRFGYAVEIDGRPVQVGPDNLAPMLSKGDAMQLGVAAVEAYIEGLPHKD